MDFVLNVKIMIDFYTNVFSVWWFKRRISLKWKKEMEYFSSDFL